MEIRKIQLLPLHLRMLFLKVLFNASQHNKIQLELQLVQHAEKKFHFVQLLLHSLVEQQIKLELQESVETQLSLLDLIPDVALEKMVLVKWLLKIQGFSEIFQKELFQSLAMVYLQRRQFNLFQIITTDLLSFVHLDQMSLFCIQTIKNLNQEKVKVQIFR